MRAEKLVFSYLTSIRLKEMRRRSKQSVVRRKFKNRNKKLSKQADLNMVVLVEALEVLTQSNRPMVPLPFHSMLAIPY